MFSPAEPSDCPIVRMSVTLGHCLSTHWLSNTRFCVLLPYLIFTNPTILGIGYRALHMLGQASYNQTKFPGYYLNFFFQMKERYSSLRWKFLELGTGEMVQCLRVLATLPEDPDSLPTTT